MIAVADASPVCYLILIGKVDLLPELFSSVLIPRAVVTELLHEDAPESVRAWAANLPSWTSVHDNPAGLMAGMEKLQAGEQNAILLKWSKPKSFCSTKSPLAALPPTVVCV